MKNIPNFAYYELRNLEHLQFMTDVDSILQLFSISEIGVEADYPSFKQYLSDEIKAVNAEQGNALTQELNNSSKLREQTWFAIKNIAKGFMNSPFEEERKLGNALMPILVKHGDPRNLGLNPQSAALTTLCNDLLLADKAELLEKMHITAWVKELQRINNEYTAKSAGRDDDLISKESIKTKAVRLQIDSAYSTMVKKINAQVLLEIAKEPVFSVIDKVNKRIQNYEVSLAIRKGQAEAPTEEKK